MALGDYLDYLDAPEKPAPGLWLDCENIAPSPSPGRKPPSILYILLGMYLGDTRNCWKISN